MTVKFCKISTKGQLTIPKEFRDKLNLHEGDEVVLYLTEDGIIIKPRIMNLRILRGLLRDEIDFEKAEEFIKIKRKKWSI
ncbi:MAG: AbrB/MazE/SpoVT family DNA-binding domain-containing protein [Promethearchaeota archaeon]